MKKLFFTLLNLLLLSTIAISQPYEDDNEQSSNKKETTMQALKRVHRSLNMVDWAIPLLEKDTFNKHIAIVEADTQISFYVRSHYDLFKIFTRMVNYGTHSYDINQEEYHQIDSIAYSTTIKETNAQGWARSYLMGYKLYLYEQELLDSAKSTSINFNNSNTDKLSLYPNPTNSLLTIKGINADNIKQLKIIDMLGKEHTKLMVQNGNVIDVSKLPKGNYILQILTFNQQLNQQFTIE